MNNRAAKRPVPSSASRRPGLSWLACQRTPAEGAGFLGPLILSRRTVRSPEPIQSRCAVRPAGHRPAGSGPGRDESAAGVPGKPTPGAIGYPRTGEVSPFRLRCRSTISCAIDIGSPVREVTGRPWREHTLWPTCAGESVMPFVPASSAAGRNTAT